jgi:hypothetical protein
VAAVYSRKYAPFNWRKLFNWDAPNPFAAGVTPFWNGRNGNATKTYVDLSTDSYFSSEIWSSTLLDIVEQIGGDSTIKLMLASMASYTDNTTMPQAAKLFMQADSILLNKYFGWKICPVFNARKMGNFPTGISESKRDLEMLSIQNSAAFANGQGDATLVLPFEADVVIYDLQGRMYQSYAKQNHNLVLRSSEFEKGMYWVRVFTPSTNATLKLIKF